jgi:hypothetical protein
MRPTSTVRTGVSNLEGMMIVCMLLGSTSCYDCEGTTAGRDRELIAKEVSRNVVDWIDCIVNQLQVRREDD